MRDYQRCTKCVMDTTDETILFDGNGVCSHCYNFEQNISARYQPDQYGDRQLRTLVDQIKKDGVGREYDCILGLSGGADSSYMAVKINEYGLRPLVIHVDAGWNSELAVHNIEKIVKYCNFDLQTCVINWEEMRDLQLAYLKAGVSNQDVPQDHAFFASLYHYAVKYKIKYILSGGNISTECVFPSWHGSAMDARNLKDIHSKCGIKKLKTYPVVSFFQYYFWYPFIHGIRTVRPLNFMPYIKKDAIVFLVREVGWKPYARKHGESVFTKFFQNYYLPSKFGYDKRIVHLSSLIMTGQISRDEALEKLKEPLYDPAELDSDIEYFCKKLRISRQEFELYLTGPTRKYCDFKNWDFIHSVVKRLQSFVERLLRRKVRIYS